MEAAPIPVDEEQRLEALLELAILDTPPEEVFDECLKVAADLCGVAYGAVSLVDRERQWFKAVVGHLPKESPREVSLCGHAIAHDEVLVVNDATADARFADNPLVAAGGLRFYAGVPLHGRDGQPLGTLCVIHDKPHELSETQLAGLKVIADHIEQVLMVRLVALRAAAIAKEATSKQEALIALDARRRQTTAMLVHDLKNPLAVVSLLGRFAQSHELPAPVADAMKELIASAEVAERMVLDMLDVASSDAGTLRTTFKEFNLADLVTRLVRRLQYLAAERGQTIEVTNALADPTVRADSVLLSRALRNFLDNAFQYGPRNAPVSVVLREHGGDVEMRVEDEGDGVARAPSRRDLRAVRSGGPRSRAAEPRPGSRVLRARGAGAWRTNVGRAARRRRRQRVLPAHPAPLSLVRLSSPGLYPAARSRSSLWKWQTPRPREIASKPTSSHSLQSASSAW